MESVVRVAATGLAATFEQVFVDEAHPPMIPARHYRITRRVARVERRIEEYFRGVLRWREGINPKIAFESIKQCFCSRNHRFLSFNKLLCPILNFGGALL